MSIVDTFQDDEIIEQKALRTKEVPLSQYAQDVLTLYKSWVNVEYPDREAQGKVLREMLSPFRVSPLEIQAIADMLPKYELPFPKRANITQGIFLSALIDNAHRYTDSCPSMTFNFRNLAQSLVFDLWALRSPRLRVHIRGDVMGFKETDGIDLTLEGNLKQAFYASKAIKLKVVGDIDYVRPRGITADCQGSISNSFSNACGSFVLREGTTLSNSFHGCFGQFYCETPELVERVERIHFGSKTDIYRAENGQWVHHSMHNNGRRYLK